MGKIIKLDRDLANKIAAGEVIERPASVVKELIENSIDAKADIIRIEIKNSGKRKIVVKDNGEGMTKEDAVLAVERHTTSKIKSAQDLFHITSLGFRGEALASIAAVSDLTIITNTGDEVGVKVSVIDGEIKDEEYVCQKGTTVIVKNLFYNTPARRKYLNSDATELKHIIDIVTRYALAYPSISFSLVHNEIEILNAPKGSLLDKILSVYGTEIAENMIRVEHEGVLSIRGYVGSMAITKKTRDFQNFFVNGRFVRSDLIREAVEEAYKSLLFLDRKPVVVLNFIINPNKIDVNIHPTKLEVKFDNPDFIKGETIKAVREALSRNIKHEVKIKEKQVKLENLDSNLKYTFSEHLSREKQALIKEAPEEKPYRILGQVNKTFIIAETDDGFMVVDQHAAAERINLERIEAMMKAENKKQRLLSPIIIRPQKKDVGLINELLPKLEEFGFEIEAFGNDEFILRQVPVVFRTELNKENMNEFFEELIANIKNSNLIDDEIIYTMACKASIKANQELSIKEMYDLLDELFKTEFPYSCAHGRPTILKFTVNELEKMFKRK